MSNQTVISEWMSGTDAVNATGDTVCQSFGCPIEVIRWGMIAGVDVVVGADFNVGLDKRITNNSDTGRLPLVGGEIQLLTGHTAAFTAGRGVYTKPTSQVIVLPGEQLVFDVTAAGTSGSVYHFIHFAMLPFQKLTKTYAPLAGLPDADLLTHLTEVL